MLVEFTIYTLLYNWLLFFVAGILKVLLKLPLRAFISLMSEIEKVIAKGKSEWEDTSSSPTTLLSQSILEPSYT